MSDYSDGQGYMSVDIQLKLAGWIQVGASFRIKGLKVDHPLRRRSGWLRPFIILK